MTTVELIEVSPRDGLQNEDVVVSTEDKLELVRRAVEAGAHRVEVTSFVNPARVPTMADADEVAAGLPRAPDVTYAGLVMNRRGLDRLVAGGLDEVNVVVVATDTFCRRNQGTSTAEACTVAGDLVAAAHEAGLTTTVTVGATFGCPFEGEVSVARLGEVLHRVADTGTDEIALADTIGVAVPDQVAERFLLARSLAPETPLRAHFHDTRNTAVANAFAAVAVGVTRLDASIGGTGGCPFAPNATGNVATEDLVYALGRSGRGTGLDLAHLVEATRWLEGVLGQRLPGALLRAGGFPPS